MVEALWESQDGDQRDSSVALLTRSPARSKAPLGCEDNLAIIVSPLLTPGPLPEWGERAKLL